MRYTVGKGIRPEFARLDYSGYADAARTRAQGMRALGSGISAAISGYKKRKEEDEKEQSAAELIVNFADKDSALGDTIRSMLVDATGEDKPLTVDNVLPLVENIGADKIAPFLLNQSASIAKERRNTPYKKAERKVDEYIAQGIFKPEQKNELMKTASGLIKTQSTEDLLLNGLLTAMGINVNNPSESSEVVPSEPKETTQPNEFNSQPSDAEIESLAKQGYESVIINGVEYPIEKVDDEKDNLNQLKESIGARNLSDISFRGP